MTNHLNLVQLRSVSVSFRTSTGSRVHALQDVSLDVGAGRLTMIVGRSGSGKSSLLHVLAGLVRADTGMVTVGATKVSALSPAQSATYRCRTVGFLFQAFHLIPHLRAWENVALPLVAQGCPQHTRRELAHAELASVGLATRADHLPTELSGGEQQRVALARATVHRPALLLADEPTGNLDADNATAVLGLLRSSAAAGNAVVCATHDEQLIAASDVVIRLEQGRCVSSLEGEACRAQG